MCIRLIVVPAGNPCSTATNDATADVTLPAESFDSTIVKVPLPLPVPSPPCTGLTSFAGESVPVNVGFVGVVGVAGDESLLQPTASRHTAANNTDRRFIRPPIVQGRCPRSLLNNRNQKNFRARLNPM